MRARLFGIVAVFAIAIALVAHTAPVRAARPSATHAPHRTPSPQPSIIYQGVARPLCAALAQHIKTVIGMLIQNDNTISKSPSLFERYNRDLGDVNASNAQTGSTAERDLTLYHLEQLVGPLASNVNAIQRELENPSVFPPNPQTEDERLLDAMRDELLKTLATQAVSLDVINGYVQTQQLAQMQQEGLRDSDLARITGSDTTYSPAPSTPNPLLADPNQAGLAPNPYALDPASVPGVTGSVGTTPLSRLIDALQWLRQETGRRENVASREVTRAAYECTPHRAPASPHP